VDFELSTFLSSIPALAGGAWTTLTLSVLSIFFATILGLVIALMRVSPVKGLRAVAGTYTWIMRGTPLLLLLFFMYFGGPSMGIELPAFTVAVIAVSLNAAAYTAEVMRAAIQGIPAVQSEAGYAVGLTYVQVFRRIVLPQAARLAVPPFINNCILLVKNSALVSVISVGDLMLASTQEYSSNFRPLEVFAAAGIYYLAMTSALMSLQAWSERKLSSSSRPTADRPKAGAHTRVPAMEG